MHTTDVHFRFGVMERSESMRALGSSMMPVECFGHAPKSNHYHKNSRGLAIRPGSCDEFVDHPDTRGATMDGAPTVLDGKGARILVVEDNLFFGQLLESFLQIAGFDPIIVDSGEKALDIYGRQRDHISLVILDLLMPRMSGKDCLMKLLELNPLVKVMVVSVLDPGDSYCKEISPYIKGFVHKPCKMSEFIQQTQRLLVN